MIQHKVKMVTTCNRKKLIYNSLNSVRLINRMLFKPLEVHS